ncbi:hypothetical protein C4J81_02360 [Deltaproteobacteria bacterium Smac51]|nr:hypothetical protein C4J81_02360 [Deltaproteobacteria bacterium Smac51]
MFEKFAMIEDQKERLEIYNILKFNLTACLRLAEFMALAVLISGLGWFIGTESTRLITPEAGPWASAGVSIALMILIFALLRLPFLLAIGRLHAAFGLDPRSGSCRLKELFGLGMRRGLVAWAVSMLLYGALIRLDLWYWTILALATGAVLVALNSFMPRLVTPEKLRPLRDGDLTPALLNQIERWTPKTGLSSNDIFVSTTFSPELTFPRLEGVGPTTKLIVNEKALSSFPPRELSILVVTGIMDALIKGPLKFMLLRFCSLAVAVPLAAILISTVGASIWAYPLMNNPVLITLVWAAAWVGLIISDFTIRLTSRGMSAQLAAAATMVMKDETSLDAALSTMAKKNLEEESPASWRELFRPQYSHQAFMKRARYHQHMSKFTE